MAKILNTEIFISKANKVHDHKYSYIKSVYINSNTKIEIICNKHGSFFQTPHGHLSGRGCKKCGREAIASKLAHSREKFIDNAIKVHMNKYCYENVVYINSSTKVEIKCPEHGSFFQTPSHHLSGIGCRMCSVSSSRLGLKDFINRAKNVHGDLYMYNETEYNGYRNKLKITCRDHGIFLQTPNVHLQGKGCPICNSSKGEKEVARVLDILGVDYEREYGIKGYKYRYDFYLNRLNIFIEYNGIQHYKPVVIFGGLKGLTGVKKRDIEKIKLANRRRINITILHNTKIDKIEDRVREVIRTFYKYSHNRIPYKTFSDLKIALKLPSDADEGKYAGMLI